MADVPFNQDAEEAVIGSLLIDPDAIFQVSELRPEDFYLERCRWMFEAIRDLASEGKSADIITISDYLKPKGRTVKESEIVRLMTVVPSSLNLIDYADIVASHAVRRNLIKAGSEIVALAYNSESDSLAGDAMVMLEDVIPKTQAEHHLRGAQGLIDYLGFQTTRSQQAIRVTSGWSAVDQWLFMEPGLLIIVAGRTGVGKTMFMECMAEHNAQRGYHVAFYHHELSHQVMLDRRMARHSGVTYNRLRNGYIGDEIHKTTDAISPWQGNTDYVHCPGWSVERLRADLVKLNHEWGVDLVVVDYLQKIPLTHMGGMNEASLIGNVVERLKTTAEELQLPIILGSQVTRRYMQSESHEPKLGDLRGSGAIEERANVVLFLHREKMDKSDWIGSDLVKIYTEKNTLGDQGETELQHDEGRYRFVEVDIVSLNDL